MIKIGIRINIVEKEKEIKKKEIKKEPIRTVFVDGFEYEIGDPTDKDCPTIQACMYCQWCRVFITGTRICLFPKVLYGKTEAYREYKNTNISIKELIEKYTKIKK